MDLHSARALLLHLVQSDGHGSRYIYFTCFVGCSVSDKRQRVRTRPPEETHFSRFARNQLVRKKPAMMFFFFFFSLERTKVHRDCRKPAPRRSNKLSKESQSQSINLQRSSFESFVDPVFPGSFVLFIVSPLR